MWEEPCISGTRGSGAVFFSGCALGCVFCQNKVISRGGIGKEVSPKELADIMLRLQYEGAHNINLVTASHFLPKVIDALSLCKKSLSIPVVYNCGGYEKVEAIKAISPFVDVFLPDFKYMSKELSKKYSNAENYFSVASRAITEMIAQKPKIITDENGMMKSGVMIRHLVLPSCRHDSIALLHFVAENFPKDSFMISIMRQYTPDFADKTAFPELKRRVTSFEYKSVVNEALKLGLSGFMQGKDCASASFTPDFDFSGIL